MQCINTQSSFCGDT